MRKQTQVELAFSDGYRLGIDPSIRISGDLKGSTGCTLIGPKGTVELAEGAINDLRHLHISEKEAAEWGVKHDDIISVRVEGPTPVTFHNIHVRVEPGFRLNVHLDTDEGNAVSLPKTGGVGRLVREEVE